jgi:hypothetical protein
LDNPFAFPSGAQIQSATMTHMRLSLRFAFVFAALSALPVSSVAQTRTGSIDLSAQITPTGARPEPVRQFPFYILTKSYADIVKEVDGEEVLPTRDKFIDDLKVSAELKTWLKAHDGVVDLSSTDLDRMLTTDDIMKIPEFFQAYESANSGGVTKGIPQPKYKDADKTANPDKYKREHDEYLAATRKFIDTHPSTVQGIELELTEINPKTPWDTMHLKKKSRTEQVAPDTAQVKYLAAKTETDLDGHAVVSGLPPGQYWISTLGAYANSGDRHLVWDVPITVQAGLPTRVSLSNLNGVELRRITAQ